MSLNAVPKPTSLAGCIVSQGEKVVGNDTVQLVDSSVFCTRVWIGAPTTGHTVAAANDGTIYVGGDAASNLSGGIPLEKENVVGFFFPIEDAAQVYLTGLNAGDVVEYIIFR